VINKNKFDDDHDRDDTFDKEMQKNLLISSIILILFSYIVRLLYDDDDKKERFVVFLRSYVFKTEFKKSYKETKWNPATCVNALSLYFKV
jgi:hypothetical protein